MIIGHHILYGKVIELDKPLLAMTKVHLETDHNLSNDGDAMEMQDIEIQTEYRMQAVIKKKLIFKTRPKPIIANVPKKV